MNRLLVAVGVVSACVVASCAVVAARRSGKGSGLRARPRPAFIPYIGRDPYWDHPEVINHNATWGNR